MPARNVLTRRSLKLEPLEDRCLPSTGPFTPGLLTPKSPAPAAVVHHSFTGEILPNLPATPTFSANTVPANGDVNPYGVAFVPEGFPGGGPLHPGDIVVSNFNANSNLQGTGTTIVSISPTGKQTLFFQGPKGLGLSTALGVLKDGFVVVGSVPTRDGTFHTVQQGSLLILDRFGFTVANLSNGALLDGPWDLAVNDQGNTAQVFVSDVLSGTVTRIDLRVTPFSVTVTGATQIASGFLHRGDPVALVIGPTGLAFNKSQDVLYVASTGDNAIYAIPHASTRTTDAGTGSLVYQDPKHLHGPLGLIQAPNGDLLTTNGDAINPDPKHQSEIVEFTPDGHFIAQRSVDPVAGAAFGLALGTFNNQTRFAAVDDNFNVLDVWNVGGSAETLGMAVGYGADNSSRQQQSYLPSGQTAPEAASPLPVRSDSGIVSQGGSGLQEAGPAADPRGAPDASEDLFVALAAGSVHPDGW